MHLVKHVVWLFFHLMTGRFEILDPPKPGKSQRFNVISEIWKLSRDYLTNVRWETFLNH